MERELIPTNAELWTLLQEQQTLVQEQRARIAELEARVDVPQRALETAPAPKRRLSRAGLLKVAAAGAAGLAGAELLGHHGADVALAYSDSYYGGVYIASGRSDPANNGVGFITQ